MKENIINFILASYKDESLTHAEAIVFLMAIEEFSDIFGGDFDKIKIASDLLDSYMRK